MGEREQGGGTQTRLSACSQDEQASSEKPNVVWCVQSAFISRQAVWLAHAAGARRSGLDPTIDGEL